MEDEVQSTHVRNEICDGYYGDVVMAGSIRGDVHFHQGQRDELSNLQNPVIVRVRRQPGSTLADLVVDADPPRPMAPSGTLYIVTLQARPTTRAVILRAARVVVESRRAPRPACLKPRIGRAMAPRYFKTELDTDPPQLHAQGPDFPFSISATDVEEFHFEAVVRSYEVRWRIELDWECAEYEGTVVIDNNGEPFEAYPVAALYSEDRAPSPINSGCGFIGHEPGCPALRFESEPAPAIRPTQRAAVSDDPYRAVLDRDAGLRVTDPDDPASWDDYRALASQVRMLLGRPDFAGQESAQFRDLLVRVVRYFFLSGQHQVGITVARPVHRQWAANLGEDHRDTLAMANRLAGCLFGSGKHQEARALWEDALPRLCRTLGESHADTLSVVGNLAASLNALGEHERARDLMEDRLRLNRQALGDDHAETLHAVSNLAISLYQTRDFEGARALQEDALTRYRRTLGEDHPQTLHEAANLAFTLEELGKAEAARALDEDTWQRRRRVLGENHPQTRASKARCRREGPAGP
ncbi:tetratricopeptide repeat protein [Streptomyces regalis]|uniref:tetratricopeptide repeat protein n=1 Tax=Streptomyces regalis TaxID=68262 RepID=UPI0007C7E736|nr:tetratricopeptide repeat protein [Streptomyces regalis]